MTLRKNLLYPLTIRQQLTEVGSAIKKAKLCMSLMFLKGIQSILTSLAICWWKNRRFADNVQLF